MYDVDQQAISWIAVTDHLPASESEMVLFWVYYMCDAALGIAVSEPKLGWFVRKENREFFETATERPDSYDLDEVSHWAPVNPPPAMRLL